MELQLTTACKLLIQAGDAFASVVGASSINILKLSKEVIEDLEELKKFEVDKVCEVKTLLSSIPELFLQMHSFTQRVADLYFHWSKMENDKNRIVEQVKRGDFKELNNYIELFKLILSDCEKSYELFFEKRDDIEKNASKAAAECEKKAAEAESKKKKFRLLEGLHQQD